MKNESYAAAKAALSLPVNDGCLGQDVFVDAVRFGFSGSDWKHFTDCADCRIRRQRTNRVLFGSPRCSLVCPKCGSANICGLMSSFFVALMEDGVTPSGEWNDWSSESEMTENRICCDCDYEFEME